MKTICNNYNEDHFNFLFIKIYYRLIKLFSTEIHNIFLNVIKCKKKILFSNILYAFFIKRYSVGFIIVYLSYNFIDAGKQLKLYVNCVTLLIIINYQ